MKLRQIDLIKTGERIRLKRIERGLMEILEKGSIPKEPKYILRCPRCNSKLKCDKKDIKNTGVYRYFTCPVCNNRNYVEDYDLECARVFDG